MNVPDLSSWLKIEPYSLGANEKSQIMLATLRDLTCWHVSECEAYRKILNLQGINAGELFQVQDIPFIPVRLFKEFDLLSI
jgi:hypothetical protein